MARYVFARDRVHKFCAHSTRAHAHIQNSGWRPPIVDHLPTPLSQSSHMVTSKMSAEA